MKERNWTWESSHFCWSMIMYVSLNPLLSFILPHCSACPIKCKPKCFSPRRTWRSYLEKHSGGDVRHAANRTDCSQPVPWSSSAALLGSFALSMLDLHQQSVSTRLAKPPNRQEIHLWWNSVTPVKFCTGKTFNSLCNLAYLWIVTWLISLFRCKTEEKYNPTSFSTACLVLNII